MTKKENKESFTSSFGVLAATLGSSVGLGNIWRFPYLTGMNGGASFLVIYIFATLLVGLPIMISEIMMGREARRDAITATRLLGPPKHPWWLLGFLGVLSSFLILTFYTGVAGWVFSYAARSVTGYISTSSSLEEAQIAFQSLTNNPFQVLAWQLVVMICIGAVLIMGVTQGIESVSKKLMPVLFLLLLIICGRSITLPGAAKGLHFLFSPDFMKVNTGSVLAALSLAFFKLSIGMGVMVTYGSYFRDDQNIPRTALKVMCADLLVSMLAGIAIFPAVFAFDFAPESGPSLLFVTIPMIFSNMAFGQIFMGIFFILTSIAALGAMISLLETSVSSVMGYFGKTRACSTLLVIVPLMFVGGGCALSESWTANMRILGMNLFDFSDFITSKVFMPTVGILTCIFVGWVMDVSRIKLSLNNKGAINNEVITNIILFALRFLSPTLTLCIMLKGLNVI